MWENIGWIFVMAFVAAIMVPIVMLALDLDADPRNEKEGG